MSNSQIIFAIVNGVFLTSSKCRYSWSPHLKHHTQYKPKWSNQNVTMLQYQNCLLLLPLSPTLEWYQLHKGCNKPNHQLNFVPQSPQAAAKNQCVLYIYLYVSYKYTCCLYKRPICVYIHFTCICIFYELVSIISPQPAARKKTPPVCKFISRIRPPVITASLPVEHQALNMNLNL